MREDNMRFGLAPAIVEYFADLVELGRQFFGLCRR
jgi:hypothetical protein